MTATLTSREDLLDGGELGRSTRPCLARDVLSTGTSWWNNSPASGIPPPVEPWLRLRSYATNIFSRDAHVPPPPPVQIGRLSCTRSMQYRSCRGEVQVETGQERRKYAVAKCWNAGL